MIDRYARQILFPGIGQEGQKKLGRSCVAIIGCGALGSVMANSLARAGVGKLRIIDRDFIEKHNLQRQVLFDESDIRKGLPKAIAAERHLKKINSSIEIEGMVTDVNLTNIEELISPADLVLDGLDNFETRFLVNDACLKHGIPWVYGGVIASLGMTMNIIPGETPCFRCVSPAFVHAGGVVPTCETAGVVNSAPFIIGSLQSTEAIKILIGSKEVNQDIIFIDVWRGTFHHLKTSRRGDCSACRGEYEFLEGKFGGKITILCGQNSVQIVNPEIKEVSFEKIAEHLRAVGKVTYNDFMLHFTVEGQEMVVFPDGRVIVKDTVDESEARGLYAKYIGA